MKTANDFIIPNLPDTAVNQIRAWAIQLQNSNDVIDLLPWLRKLLAADDGWQTLNMDYMLEHDLQVYFAKHDHDIPGINFIGLHSDHPDHEDLGIEDYNSWVLRDHEFDYIISNIVFETEYTKGINPEKEPSLLLSLLLLIVLFDCSNCCNALSYIRMTKDGILAVGDISETYHS